jgi:hypothetical protein
MEYKEKDLKRIQNSLNFLAHLLHARISSAIFRRPHPQFGAAASSKEPERRDFYSRDQHEPDYDEIRTPGRDSSARRSKNSITRCALIIDCSLLLIVTLYSQHPALLNLGSLFRRSSPLRSFHLQPASDAGQPYVFCCLRVDGIQRRRRDLKAGRSSEANTPYRLVIRESSAGSAPVRRGSARSRNA